mmetsp:Transcript_73481/g.207528  ORF Transcript_73481/g.207528 Transcript_73481/m.207528 type:complete len:273 (-) Transcript_73481:191-1009(-)
MAFWPTSPSSSPELNGLERGDTSLSGQTASSLVPSIQKPSKPSASAAFSAMRTVRPTCSYSPTAEATLPLRGRRGTTSRSLTMRKASDPTTSLKYRTNSELPTRGAPKVYIFTLPKDGRLLRYIASASAEKKRLALASHDWSSRSLKPRIVLTLPVRSGDINDASAPPREWPVMSSSHSPGEPPQAATSSSLRRRLTAFADSKKPECTRRGSSDFCFWYPCSSGVCTNFTSVRASMTSDVPRNATTRRRVLRFRQMATSELVALWVRKQHSS